MYCPTDFCEDEDALIRQGNSNVQALRLQEVNSTDFEDLFLPNSGLDSDELMATSLLHPFDMMKHPPDEVLELDQGVAMDVSADQPNFVTKSRQTYELTLTSPVSTSPSASSSFFADVLYSPTLTNPTQNQTFTYLTSPPPPVSVHSDQLVGADITTAPLSLPPPPPLISLSTTRQDSELDLLCSILGEDMASCNNQATTTVDASKCSTAGQIQLEAVQKLIYPASPRCDDAKSTVTDCDTSSLFSSSSFDSSLSSPTPWTDKGRRMDIEHMNKESQTERMSHVFKTTEAKCSETTPSSPNIITSESSLEKERLVHMPFYDFKKIIDNPTVPERDKEEVKNIRRRGKNKAAAKVCRQRKLDLINGLQHEIDLLKAEKDKLLARTQTEQHRIQWYKDRWNKLISYHGNSS